MSCFITLQPRIRLLPGPQSNIHSNSQHDKHDDTRKHNQEKGNTIPVLIGYHTVPPVAKARILSPGYWLGHIKPSDAPSVTYTKDKSTKDDTPGGSHSAGKRKQLARKFLENIKGNRNFVFTILATLGIPAFLLFMFFFEVSEYHMQ